MPNTSSANRGGPSLGRAIAWVVAGVVLVGLYHGLAALEVGAIGAPSDIGGGGILVAGYVLIGVGAVKTLLVLRSRRAQR